MFKSNSQHGTQNRSFSWGCLQFFEEWVIFWFCQVCNGRSLAVYLLWPTFDPLFVGTDGTHFLRSLDGGPKTPPILRRIFFSPKKSETTLGGIPVVSPAGGNRAIHGTTGEATLDTFSSHVHLSGEGEHLGICLFVLVVGWGISSMGKKLKNESRWGGVEHWGKI